jgi:uracil phosphoribosyltransferase
VKTKFVDVAAAAVATAELATAAVATAELATGSPSDVVVVAILPGAAAAGPAVAKALGAASGWVTVDVDETGDLVVDLVEVPADLSAHTIVVVALAIETGQESAAVGRMLLERGAQGMVLLAAICPREAEPHLRAIYADVWAVVRPLVRRSAAWHFERLDVPTTDAALRIARAARLS